MENGAERLRIDKWLFFARIVKSRSLAAKLTTSGKIRIDGEKISSAAKGVRIGDCLTITLERRVLILKIVALGSRRGPYSEARLLYEDLTPEPVSDTVGAKSHNSGIRDAGHGRPTKKQRRALDRLQNKM